MRQPFFRSNNIITFMIATVLCVALILLVSLGNFANFQIFNAIGVIFLFFSFLAYYLSLCTWLYDQKKDAYPAEPTAAICR